VFQWKAVDEDGGHKLVRDVPPDLVPVGSRD
jgi:hypothetical protein